MGLRHPAAAFPFLTVPQWVITIETLLRVDQIVNPAEPRVMIIYLPNEDGELQLVGVEYIVPFTGSNSAPELFGQTFHYNAARSRYELHAWLWRNNPDGIFADYNPRLRCPSA